MEEKLIMEEERIKIQQNSRESLQQEMEDVCKILGENSFHEFADLKQEYDNSIQKPTESAMKAMPQSDVAKAPVPEVKKVLLKLPTGLSREERKELEDALFKAGARYSRETIPAEKSHTGKEVNYKSWYVWQNENMDMTPFLEYIRDEKPFAKQNTTNKENTSQKSINDTPEIAHNEKSKNTETNKEWNRENSEKRIYLNIPHVNKLAFQIITSNLKNDGAKFDGEAKAWYITEKEDFNKFKSFLGLSREQVINKRESVLSKLNENKAAIENRKESNNEVNREAMQRDTLSK